MSTLAEIEAAALPEQEKGFTTEDGIRMSPHAAAITAILESPACGKVAVVRASPRS